MNVYVETNFLLELAFLQEQHESCESIMGLCKAGKIGLILPAYSMVEPFETLTRHYKRRTELRMELEKELDQLGRTSSYTQRVRELQEINTLLIRCNEEERQRLEEMRARLMKIAEIIPLDSTVLAAAPNHEAESGLSPQDAVVYASVLHHLSHNPTTGSCFLNKNSKDFGDPDIVDALAQFNCKILLSFDQGRNYVQSRVTD